MQIVIYMYYRYKVNDLHMDVDKYNSGHREETRQTIQQLIPDAQQTKPTKNFDPINGSGRNRFSQNKHSDQLLQQPSVPVGRGEDNAPARFRLLVQCCPGMSILRDNSSIVSWFSKSLLNSRSKVGLREDCPCYIHEEIVTLSSSRKGFPACMTSSCKAYRSHSDSS